MSADLYELFEASEEAELITLEATVTTGLESVAASEIREKISFLDRVCKRRGRVFFNTRVDCVQEVLLLHSIDHLYLVVSIGKDVIFSENKVSSLSSLERLIVSPKWNKVINIWKNVSKYKGNCFPSKEQHSNAVLEERILKQRVEELWAEKEIMKEFKDLNISQETTKSHDKNSYKEKRNELKQSIMLKADRKAFYHTSDTRVEEDKVLKFRMTCHRSGNHSFTSPDVARSLGGKLQDMFNWVVDMVNHDLEVVASIREELVYMGLSLTPDSLHKRNIIHFGPTTLRATVCYNLLRLTAPRTGEIVIDPLCGGGSIPIEGAVAFNGIYNIAGDNHPLAISRAIENLHFMKNEKQGYIDFVHWDVTKLPLRDACMDILVTDLPFGKRSGSKQNNQVLYQKAMLEIGRCVVPSGRAVCLTWDKSNFTRTIRAYKIVWSLIKIMSINLGGLPATAYVLKRTSESLATLLEKLQKKRKKKKSS